MSRMASASILALLAIFLLPLLTAAGIGDILSPLLSPVMDDVCKEVKCGKGTCKPSTNSSVLFECECEAGWKQTRPVHDNLFKFLPCVVPNCSLDYSCSQAPPPAQEKANPFNGSLLDPCQWSYCGGGSCNKTSRLAYSCECSEGYSNLLNATVFPCFKQCAIGMDCRDLGFTVTNESTPLTPTMADSGENHAWSVLQGDFYWLISIPISIFVLIM